MSEPTPAVRFASNPERLDREGLLALVRDLQRTVAIQQQTIERQRAALAGAAFATVSDGQESMPEPATPARNGHLQAETAPANRRTPPTAVPGADYTVVFDGGSLGNPGKGYGSYLIVDGHGAVVTQRRVEFGDSITNNGAEFRTLIVAMERLLQHLGDGARNARVAVRGDSQLVINGVSGRWKIKHEDLKPLRERAVRLLDQFASVDIAWHARDQSVRSLGH